MNKNGAKYKVLTESDDPKNANKFKLKFTVAVKGKTSSDANVEKPKPWYVIEHCQARFLNPADRDNFIEVYKKLTEIKD